MFIKAAQRPPPCFRTERVPVTATATQRTPTVTGRGVLGEALPRWAARTSQTYALSVGTGTAETDEGGNGPNTKGSGAATAAAGSATGGQ